MAHVVRHARVWGPRLGFTGSRAALGMGESSPGSDVVTSLVGSVRALATGGHSRPALRHEICWSFHELLESSDGSPSLLGCVSRSFSSNSHAPASLFLKAAGIQVTTMDYGLGFHQRQPLIALQRSVVRGDRGFAKAVALPPQMQKPMKLRVFMGSPGVIGEPWKPLPPPLPFFKRWFTREGWKIRKQNVQGMLKTGFTLAKIRQKTKGYNQTKFYRDAFGLYKEINSALAAGDRSALRQLVTDNVLTAMKKELKHREQAWARVHWELVGPVKTIRTLQGRLIGIDQKNMDTAFAQLTIRIISNQKFAAYDKQGKLVAGDPEKELKVEDIWVFERQISHPELRWKLCGRLSV